MVSIVRHSAVFTFVLIVSFLGNALCMEQEEVGGRERKERITCQKKIKLCNTENCNINKYYNACSSDDVFQNEIEITKITDLQCCK